MIVDFLIWYGAAVALIGTTLGLPLVDTLIHERNAAPPTTRLVLLDDDGGQLPAAVLAADAEPR